MLQAERAHYRLAQHAEAESSYKLQNAELSTEVRALRIETSDLSTKYTVCSRSFLLQPSCYVKAVTALC